jgi:hypothetical protein
MRVASPFGSTTRGLIHVQQHMVCNGMKRSVTDPIDADDEPSNTGQSSAPRSRRKLIQSCRN